MSDMNVILALVFFLSPLIPREGKTDIPLQKRKSHIVFLISEDPDNYEATRTIPVFARQLEKEHGFKATVLLGKGPRSGFSFPGLEVISGADLLVIFCRRVALPPQQLDMIRNFLKAGKPLVGIRTANHAFSVREQVQEGHEAWWEFVPVILGCENRGYGPVEAGTDVAVAPGAKEHATLQHVSPLEWHSRGNLYLQAPLIDTNATVLLTGTADNKTEPIAWTRVTADKSRVFYTSLGYPDDFDTNQFKTLLLNGINWALGKI
jgi:type 1 glutamine amidotransferase